MGHCPKMVKISPALHKASKGIGPLKYTVNLYHTRSSMMVNGRDAEAFTRAHKVALGQILNIQNLDSIDDELHSILVRELDNIRVGSLSTNLKAKSVKDKEQAVKILPLNGKTTDHLSDCTPDMPPQFLCLHCGQSAHTNVIECSACTEWFHFDCEGMSLAESQAYDYAERDYICNICKMEHQNQTATEDIEVSTDRQMEETGTGDVVPLNGLGPTDIDKSTPIHQPDPVIPISTASTGERTSNTTTDSLGPPAIPSDNSHKKQTKALAAVREQDKNKASSNKSLTAISQSGQCQNNSDTLAQDGQDVLAEQMVKSKEKILNSREKKLKELEKKLHIKEISLSDQVQQNDFSKAYIVTMENKVKELESSNRLMKMKLLSQADASIDLPTPRDTSSN